MSEPKTVYSVSSGSYSDYRVEKLFESREDAERFADGGGGQYTDGFVEEFQLYPAGTEGYEVWRAMGWTSRGLDEIRIESSRAMQPGPRRPEVRTHPMLGIRGMGDPGYFVSASCADRNAAIKSVKDRIAQMIAQGA